MEKRLTNDENIKNLQIRKVLRILIIIFSVITIVLSLLSLIIGISFAYGLITYIIVVILSRKRNSTQINKSKKITEVEDEIDKVKKHKK